MASVTVEMTFRPDGTFEDAWGLSSSLTPDETERVVTRLLSAPAVERNAVFHSVVSALSRTVPIGEYRNG